MFAQTLIQTTLLAAVATAASLPVRQTTTTFRLAANVTNFDLTPSIQGQELTYISTADCTANVVFGPAGQGAEFYATGNTVNVAHLSGDDSSPSAGLIVTPGGTATVPSLNTVQLQCGAGTSGVGVVDGSLQFEDGFWMACPRNDSVVLSFKKAGQRTLLGCADVQLLSI
ncbi:hypothetical protein CMEL01_02556 [Colletotrichum melonis]|uniref:DUF7907 domain-containing protein n=3 Tax=Colletotrichum acutatum species complex TaxID=2707335 RepID=A0AAJ0E4Z7_9PEZI|nr:uncharacterized protein CCOS01_03148 [Colletotrichum costaricense]KAI3552324.1 hypothetical protein CSPX01_00073 [Colletotrichum filicis]KAK0372645.1 hypothetical protein CLIM01_10002 [Colletotrichum limetticola]KAK1459557.1 hypothetical protein CMEL01_02556 [Colletotrichum melonis]KAK1534396.1 hypothetical protein CCOS01_03148 [Colletotrichum costaricense]